MMVNIDAEVFQLLDEKLDLVLLGIAAHVPKLFVFVSSDDLVNGSCDPVGDSHLCLVGRA